MNKLKLFIENFLVYGLGGVISKIVPLIMVPIVTRLMPSTDYFGLSDLSNTVVSFASAFAVMGMYDAMPTLANMLGVSPKYNLGNDIMNLTDNVVVFPNGNWLTNNIYYNSQKDQYKILNTDYVVNNDEIEKNNEYAAKRLNISNDIIKYDLIKTEKDKLKQVEGE